MNNMDDNNQNYVTVVFKNVPDGAQLDSIVSSVSHFPIVKKHEQNNGIIAYVVQGVLPEYAEHMFRQELEAANLQDVQIVTSLGNVFSF